MSLIQSIKKLLISECEHTNTVEVLKNYKEHYKQLRCTKCHKDIFVELYTDAELKIKNESRS